MATTGLKPDPPEFITMRTSLTGLLTAVADSVRGHYGMALRNLLANLAELKIRTDSGDQSALTEFFSIYVIEVPRANGPKEKLHESHSTDQVYCPRCARYWPDQYNTMSGLCRHAIWCDDCSAWVLDDTKDILGGDEGKCEHDI